MHGERLRLRHRRRRLGRLRAGQPAERGRRQRAPARGRRARHASLHPHPARHGPDARLPDVRLGLRDRAGAEPQRPPHRGDARQGAGRLIVDQRDGLYARPSRRLRPLGAEGRARLVLCRRAALFQTLRELGRRRERVSRRIGPARHAMGEDAGPALRRVDRSRQGRGLSAHRGLQRRAAGRLRAQPILHPQRPPLIGRERVPQARDGAQEPRRRGRARRRPACSCRARARPASSMCSNGQTRAARGRRSDPRGRRVQHAAAPDALRHRAGRASRARSASSRWSICRSARTCRTIWRR